MRLARTVMLPAVLSVLLVGLGALAQPASAWEPVEQVKTYKVSGTTGFELYRSVGENGPVIAGDRRTIAHTTFKLTWRRDYQERDGGCVIASNIPKLIITYTLPEPRGELPPALAASWTRWWARSPRPWRTRSTTRSAGCSTPWTRWRPMAPIARSATNASACCVAG